MTFYDPSILNNSLLLSHQSLTDLHRIPEIGFNLYKTADYIYDVLKSIQPTAIFRGHAKTGIVAVIERDFENCPYTIAFRADMDALPIQEATDLPYKSTISGRMHACGHDGHSAMLIGAACYIARSTEIKGRFVFIFQPAEETGGGAQVMCNNGIIEQFRIDEIHALHNLPGLPIGEFFTREGAITASIADFEITFKGRGGHAATPHRCSEALLASAHTACAVQSIVSREIPATEPAIISVCEMHSGSANNIIPDEARLAGTIRCYDTAILNLCANRLGKIASSMSEIHGTSHVTDITFGYPSVKNATQAVQRVTKVLGQTPEIGRLRTDGNAQMWGEDFAYFLQRVPGALTLIGAGDCADLHDPHYVFNPDILKHGILFWVGLSLSLHDRKYGAIGSGKGHVRASHTGDA